MDSNISKPQYFAQCKLKVVSYVKFWWLHVTPLQHVEAINDRFVIPSQKQRKKPPNTCILIFSRISSVNPPTPDRFKLQFHLNCKRIINIINIIRMSFGAAWTYKSHTFQMSVSPFRIRLRRSSSQSARIVG